MGSYAPMRGDKIVFRVSSLCGTCWRKVYLYACGVEEEPLNQTILDAFQAGHDTEEQIIQYAAKHLSDAPYIIGSRNMAIVPIETNEVIIEGHIDAILQRVSDSNLVLLEAKNLSSTTISRLKNQGGVQGATPNYYTQLQLYMYGMQHHGLDLEGAVFIARNKRSWKDSDPRKYFVQRFEFDMDEVKNALEKADAISECIKTNVEVPPPEDPHNVFFCREGWCAYSKNCRDYWNEHHDVQNKEVL